MRVLSRLMEQRGVPKVLFCDNGSEFTGQMMDMWDYRNGVKIDFSRPGKPTDNPYVAYCTSLEHCGKIRFEVARSWSLIPCCFRGGLSSSS